MLAQSSTLHPVAWWISNNPIPKNGCWGLETDTNLVKYGDGLTAWNSLSYFGYYTSTNSGKSIAIVGAGSSISFLTGNGVPASSLGFDGYHYMDINPASGKLYIKSSGTWTAIANISLS